MGKATFSRLADRDLIEIYLYGIEHFGLHRADTYQNELLRRIDLLADNPSFGNDYGFVTPGARRYESEAHAIYYRASESGILILRILRGSMDFARHIS